MVTMSANDASKAEIGMNRRFVGFGISKPIFKSRGPKISHVTPGASHANARAGVKELRRRAEIMLEYADLE